MPDVPSPENEEETRIFASLSNGITMLSIVSDHVRALLKTFGDCNPHLCQRKLCIVKCTIEIVLIQWKRYVRDNSFTINVVTRNNSRFRIKHRLQSRVSLGSQPPAFNADGSLYPLENFEILTISRREAETIVINLLDVHIVSSYVVHHIPADSDRPAAVSDLNSRFK